MQAGDGTIWVVWVSNRYLNDELFYRTSSDYGLSWSLDKRLTVASSADSSPSIMQASNGTIWVAWASHRTGNYEIYYKTSSNNGETWTPDTQRTFEFNEDEDPSIMQASNGLIWVVWSSSRTGNYELFYETYDGSAWSTETQITDNPGSDKYPSVVQARNGSIWVVWSSNRTGNYELFYKTFNGTNWSSHNQLTDDSSSDMVPSIAEARDGSIWVVWQSGRPAEDQDELYYKVYNCSAWSSDAQLTSDSMANDIASSIAQVSDRKIWVMWAADKDEDFDIYYKTSSEIDNYDVAITDLTSSAGIVNPGEIVSINVGVENRGDENETFDVYCYANTTTIGSTTITLANGTSTTLGFSWDTTVVDKGRYTITAEASVVPGEIYSADNVYVNGAVTVTIYGDVNGDGQVDAGDLAVVGDAYGTVEGNSGYNPDADLNDDQVLDVLDLAECGKNYGEIGF